MKESQPQETGVFRLINLLSGSSAAKVVSSEEVDGIRTFSFHFLLVLESKLISLFLIVAGPNRPPARIRLYEVAGEVGREEGNVYERMMHAAQERGCVLPFSATCGNMLILDLDPRERLADMNERTKELEEASHNFAAQVRCGC